MDDSDDPAMKQVLSRARRGWSPSSDDAERVRRRVQAALAGGIPEVRPRGPRPPAWVGRMLLTAAFTAAGAGAGYWAGRRAERRAPRAMTGTLASAPVGAMARPAPLPPPQPQPRTAVRPTPDLPRRTEPPRRRQVETPSATPAESLAVEVRALRNVERALRDRNPGLASAFLDDLDRAVPGGQMREERSALRAIARCTGGQQPFGVNLADEFRAAFPASAYQARVEQACGTDSRPHGD
jgi:hypothetical protein